MTLKPFFKQRSRDPHVTMKVLFPVIIGLLIIPFAGMPAYSQSAGTEEPQLAAEEVTPDRWPRTVDVKGAKYTIYQPQIDAWDGYHFKAHGAVSVLPAGARTPSSA